VRTGPPNAWWKACGSEEKPCRRTFVFWRKDDSWMVDFKVIPKKMKNGGTPMTETTYR